MASLTILPGGSRRLEPPPELGEGSIERAVFRQTVAAVTADHFQAEDMPLLAAYCRACALERRAADELAAGAVAGAMPSPWLAVHASAVRALSTLTVRLRLGPRSRGHHPRAASKTKSPPSYYETMAIDHQPQAVRSEPGWPTSRK
jgi:hypothetical protein